MPAFAAILQATQSADGFTILFTDASLYGSASDQGYEPGDFIRTIELLDAANELIAVLEFAGTDLTVSYPITKDQFISGELFLTGDTSFNNLVLFPFDRITKNVYRNLLKRGCCSDHSTDQRLAFGDIFFQGCSIEGVSGNGVAFDKDIAAAYAYLTGPSW